MSEVTTKFLKDEDIDIERIQKRLIKLESEIQNNNKMNLTDVNIICEEVFGKILNKIYDLELVSMSAKVSANYVAVDLVDAEKRVAYQVTSNKNASQKIKGTIEKFNGSKKKLYEEFDELNILFLNFKEISQKDKSVVLNNGRVFSYSRNILNFSNLLQEIQKIDDEKKGFIVEIYDLISMVFDSGRLKSIDLGGERGQMNKSEGNGLRGLRQLVINYEGTQLTAYIPESYKQRLSCKMEMNQSDVSGAFITFDQDTLINDYFVSEEEFERKHKTGRFIDDDEMSMTIQKMLIYVNAHTAYHIFKMFDELEKEYRLSQDQIDATMGTKRMPRKDENYFLMTISEKEWDEILLFKNDHDFNDTSGEVEWNIFESYSNRDDNCTVLLFHNMSDEDDGGDVIAGLHVESTNMGDARLNLYWQPGFTAREVGKEMENFDNRIKWKADFTRDWVKNKLLDKAHDYYVSVNKRTLYKSPLNLLIQAVSNIKRLLLNKRNEME